ncbi:MAG: hypothetical protein M3N18_06285 [Actinomycetota bacterium]|nr:hypothetical protein [Actinomycetota bacterium]
MALGGEAGHLTGGLRRRLQRLEEVADSETMTLVCPECGGEFTVYGDAPAEYLVWLWGQGYAGETHRETPADMARAFEHEHDPGAFLEKRSGLSFLSKAVSGMDLGGARVS